MSEASVDDVTGLEMDGSKRETKLTAKALANKIESLQREQKKDVNKIKGPIPEMKSLTTRKENASQLQMLFKTLVQLCENASKRHDMLIPLLSEDEQEKHNEWFLSIMKYSNTFKDSSTLV